MLYEEKRILLHRVICGILLLIGIIVPICVANMPIRTEKSGMIIKEDSGYLIDYNSSSNVSYCEIELVFNTTPLSAHAKIEFYDINNVLLAKKEDLFFGEGKRVSSTFYVDGQVDRYEILSFDCESYNDIVARDIVPIVFIYVDIVFFLIFMCSMLLSCKVYDFNGIEIIVYAGWYHHYIKINGEKTDEHNTLISYTPIYLQCSLWWGDEVEATISLTNRIALKINNRLYN